MLYFVFFILGIVFITFIIPILDQLLSLILTFLEMVKCKWSLKIAETNTLIKQAAEPEEPEEKKYYIGFTVPDSEDDTDVQV